MNTNETKAKIWNMCVEKGIFNKVKGEDFKKIQDIFETIIKGYEKVEPNQDIFNKVMDSISFEIQNQNKIISQVSFETIQKEYDELLNNPIPKKIDFTTLNQPLIQAVNQPLNDGLENKYQMHTTIQDQSHIQTQSQSQNQIQQIKLEEIIMTQNKILIKILETQVKIIEALKK